MPELKAQAREVWRLSLPAILTQITTIAMQYIDSAMVGALGANASASIGLVSTSTWLIGGIIGGVSAGFSVQASHRIGGGDDRGARTVVRHGLATGMLIAVILAALAALISEPLPRWLHGDEAIRADACAYFLTFALMVPFSQLNSLCASFLQSAGDMVSPSILNAVMCVLDVFFNALFIPRCGVFGAGLGTASACAVVSLLMAVQCLLRNPHLHMRRKEKDTVRGAILKKAFRIGFPVALQEVFLCAAMVVQTRIIAPLGAVAVAANSFAVTAEGFCYMPGYGLGAAAATLVGRSVGAGETRLARQQGNICTAMGALFMAVTAGIMALICPWVFRLLTPDGGGARARHAGASHRTARRAALRRFHRRGGRAARNGRYVRAEHYESMQHLDRAAGACARARAADGTARHVDRYGDRALRARTSDALPAAYNEIL